MAFLHQKGIVQRDLKAENILLFPNGAPSGTSSIGTLKLADFGVAASIEQQEGLFGVFGTVPFIAPEVYATTGSSGGYGTPADMFSAGVLLYWLLSGDFPPLTAGNLFPDKSTAARSLVEEFSREPWLLISDCAQKLISSLLQADPALRLSANDVLCHSWWDREVPGLLSKRRRRPSEEASSEGEGSFHSKEDPI